MNNTPLFRKVKPLKACSNYIDGYFRASSGSNSFENLNPCDMTSAGVFPQSTAEDVDYAFSVAKESLSSWKKTSRIKRAEILLKVAGLLEKKKDIFATAISLETGKSFNESIAEVNEAIHMAHYAFGSGRTPTGETLASEIAEKDAYMIRKPKGVVAIISPWNFPLAIGAFWCAAPALVEGNTVIIKPSEDAPLSTHLAAELYDQAGLPKGVLGVVHGDGTVGDYLAKKEVDHICFTGSAEVGQHIRKVCAESWHKTCSCEMGSKSAVIVFDDANIDLAVSASLASAFKLSGQRCVSSGRIIVQRSILKDFIEQFIGHANNIKTGSPFNKDGTANTDAYMGPIINMQQVKRVMMFNEIVKHDPDVELLLEGELKAGRGYFVTPTVYTTEWSDASYLKNEVFGPHVAIIPFDTTDDAVRIYNDTDYGLAVGVITNDFKKARICRDNCDYGMCYWNGGSIAAESHMGFGGVKKSGNGFPSAARTFRAVTHEVAWTVNHDDKISFPQGMDS